MTSGNKYFLFTCDVEYMNEDTPRGIRKIASLLEVYGLRGTFFVNGLALKAYGRTIDELRVSGHEIGSHGFSHVAPHPYYNPEYRFLDQLGEEGLKIEIERSYKMFEKVGMAVEGFRSPSFRINRAALAHIGRLFHYDSSQIKGAIQDLSPLSRGQDGGPISLPVNLMFRCIPFGTPYLLAFGFLAKWLIKMHLAKTASCVFYCHCYDMIPFRAALKISKIKHMVYYRQCGSVRSEAFFRWLIQEALRQGYTFLTCGDYLKTVKIDPEWNAVAG